MLLTCDKIARKRQSSKEVWRKIFGTINARRECHDVRLELAKHEWTPLKSNDSLECRNCHSSVVSSKQTQRAAEIHTRSSYSVKRRVSIAARASRTSCRTWNASIRGARVTGTLGRSTTSGVDHHELKCLVFSFHGNTIECTTQSRWSKLTHRPVAQAYLR